MTMTTTLTPAQEAAIETYFVMRETSDPEADIERNWSSFVGGGCLGPICAATEEDAREEWENQGGSGAAQFKYHNKLGGFCQVHYAGLGAWALEAENMEAALIEARKEAKTCPFACTTEAGDGHFFAHQVVRFEEVPHPDKCIYVFELKSKY